MSRTHIPMYLKKKKIFGFFGWVNLLVIWAELGYDEVLSVLKSKLKYLGLSSFTTVFLSCIAAKDSLYTMCWRYWGFATNFLAFFSLLTSRTSLCLRTSSHVLPISVWIIFFWVRQALLVCVKSFYNLPKKELFISFANSSSNLLFASLLSLVLNFM